MPKISLVTRRKIEPGRREAGWAPLPVEQLFDSVVDVFIPEFEALPDIISFANKFYKNTTLHWRTEWIPVYEKVTHYPTDLTHVEVAKRNGS